MYYFGHYCAIQLTWLIYILLVCEVYGRLSILCKYLIWLCVVHVCCFSFTLYYFCLCLCIIFLSPVKTGVRSIHSLMSARHLTCLSFNWNCKNVFASSGVPDDVLLNQWCPIPIDTVITPVMYRMILVLKTSCPNIVSSISFPWLRFKSNNTQLLHMIGKYYVCNCSQNKTPDPFEIARYVLFY